MKLNILLIFMLSVITLVSCGKAEESVESKSEINDEQGILRSIKYYNNNGTILFSKTIKCSIQRNHDDHSGILDVTILDTESNRTIDIQGNGTLVMEELPEVENVSAKK